MTMFYHSYQDGNSWAELNATCVLLVNVGAVMMAIHESDETLFLRQFMHDYKLVLSVVLSN
jgi:hypothetical protein